MQRASRSSTCGSRSSYLSRSIGPLGNLAQTGSVLDLLAFQFLCVLDKSLVPDYNHFRSKNRSWTGYGEGGERK